MEHTSICLQYHPDVTSGHITMAEFQHEEQIRSALRKLCSGLPLDPLPEVQRPDPKVPHAPVRKHTLTPQQKKLAVRNALRYFSSNTHRILAPEFLNELKEYGHIYMYRFLPDIPLRAYPVSFVPAKCPQAAAIIVMILNNLDPEVAQFPQELVTYGGNGQVFSNWAQFRITLHLLSVMSERQTLSLYSGHPMGLFPSNPHSPRAVITNGMVVPNYSSKAQYDNMFALGVTMYGQMTAGSYCYIGPQGIVHGTTITLLNAGRRYLDADNLAGRVFVTAGLGGMSGAQAKAAVLAGCIGVVAEVCPEAIRKRREQGWVLEVEDDLDRLIRRVRQAKAAKEPLSIAFHGNVVLLWEKLAEEPEMLVDLGSDQTSCHDVHGGGYWPADLAYPAAKEVLASDPVRFAKLVDASLVRQVNAINKLAARGMKFWDYGNAFLLESHRAGADVGASEGGNENVFRYPSYVQDIMGNIFSLGFGPFRWVCLSGSKDDLNTTDRLAAEVLQQLVLEEKTSLVAAQYQDNLKWISAAGAAKLVVGSQARILYSDREGRRRLAARFNEAVRKGLIQGPIAISRDHHDVSGTDSPYRETSDVQDGSAFTADMAVQNCIGDSFRGATWVSLHNGGGVGWGEVINGGFGLVLDGSQEAGQRADLMLAWDVDNGVARRCWSGNANAMLASKAAMKCDPLLQLTLPNSVDDSVFGEEGLCANWRSPNPQ